MVTFSEELDAWNWFGKVVEKATFIRLSVLDKRDISEADYDLLKVFYKIWHNGEYPLYQNKMEGSDTTAIQQPLFPDNLSLFDNGINIEKTLS
jgi:hypothetical protein